MGARRNLALAQLKVIETLPISRPVYRRPDLLSSRGEWIAENRDLLRKWFGNSQERDWDVFCNDQLAREQDQHDAFKDTYRGP